MNKMISKKEKQGDIIILDEGINSNNMIELIRECCPVIILLLRG